MVVGSSLREAAVSPGLWDPSLQPPSSVLVRRHSGTAQAIRCLLAFPPVCGAGITASRMLGRGCTPELHPSPPDVSSGLCWNLVLPEVRSQVLYSQSHLMFPRQVTSPPLWALTAPRGHLPTAHLPMATASHCPELSVASGPLISISCVAAMSLWVDVTQPSKVHAMRLSCPTFSSESICDSSRHGCLHPPGSTMKGVRCFPWDKLESQFLALSPAHPEGSGAGRRPPSPPEGRVCLGVPGSLRPGLIHSSLWCRRQRRQERQGGTAMERGSSNFS